MKHTFLYLFFVISFLFFSNCSKNQNNLEISKCNFKDKRDFKGKIENQLSMNQNKFRIGQC